MKLYLDANAVLPLLLTERESERLAALIASTPAVPIISDFGAGEIAASISRRLRTGDLRPKTATCALATLDIWRAQVEVLAIGPTTISDATALVRRFELKLRMPDAIHLALCAENDLRLVTNDQTLLSAAVAVNVAAISTTSP